jgi:predicted RNA-binding protein Jag
MDNLKSTIEELLVKSGFQESRVEIEPETKKLAVFINEGEWLKERLPRLVLDFNYLANLISKKQTNENVFVDINNYRKDRERIIIELAKAAARKALLTKTEIQLPAMNAYERRLIHVELSTRPDVKTESIGVGDGRGVVVKPI